MLVTYVGHDDGIAPAGQPVVWATTGSSGVSQPTTLQPLDTVQIRLAQHLEPARLQRHLPDRARRQYPAATRGRPRQRGGDDSGASRRGHSRPDHESPFHPHGTPHCPRHQARPCRVSRRQKPPGRLPHRQGGSAADRPRWALAPSSFANGKSTKTGDSAGANSRRTSAVSKSKVSHSPRPKKPSKKPRAIPVRHPPRWSSPSAAGRKWPTPR